MNVFFNMNSFKTKYSLMFALFPFQHKKNIILPSATTPLLQTPTISIPTKETSKMFQFRIYMLLHTYTYESYKRAIYIAPPLPQTLYSYQ